MQLLHFEHCIYISLVCSLFKSWQSGKSIFPREIVATADSKGAFFGTFFRSAGRKESTKKSGVALQLWLLLTLTVCYSHTLRLHTVVVYVLSFHQERKNQRKCFLFARHNTLPREYETSRSVIGCNAVQTYKMYVHLSKSCVRAADGVPCIKFAVLRLLC